MVRIKVVRAKVNMWYHSLKGQELWAFPGEDGNYYLYFDISTELIMESGIRYLHIPREDLVICRKR